MPFCIYARQCGVRISCLSERTQERAVFLCIQFLCNSNAPCLPTYNGFLKRREKRAKCNIFLRIVTQKFTELRNKKWNKLFMLKLPWEIVISIPRRILLVSSYSFCETQQYCKQTRRNLTRKQARFPPRGVAFRLKKCSKQ